MGETTTGGLLNGRVTYRQLRAGHRTGFEPVLLAASVPAKPGELVLEAGTGAGAGLLCLAARVPGMLGFGIERDAALSTLANENFQSNRFNCMAFQADATCLPFPAQSFHHVMANPPWFGAHNTASPHPLRALAHQARPGMLEDWIASLVSVLKPKGSITLILPANTFPAAACALRLNCGGITLFPLWPRLGEAAKITIISAGKGSKNPDRILPGLVLHDDHGINPAAEAVLRDGQSTIGVSNTA